MAEEKSDESPTNKAQHGNSLTLWWGRVLWLVDEVSMHWQASEYFRWGALTVFIYLCGRLHLPIAYLIALLCAVLVSVRTENEREHNELRAQYIKLDENPDLVKKLIKDIPRWLSFPDCEKARWLNHAGHIFWPYVRTATEDTIRWSVDPILNDCKPNFLSFLRFGVINLGDLEPHFDSHKVYDKDIAGNEIVWDIEFSYFGKNAEIVIETGNQFLPLSAALRNISIEGTFRLVFTDLISEWPCFASLRMGFTEKPKLNYNLSAIKMPLDKIPGFRPWLTNTIEELLQDHFTSPNELYLPLWPECIPGYAEAKQPERADPQGCLRVTVIEARNLVNRDLFGKSDPLVKLTVKKPALVTRKKKNTLNPVWEETFEFIVVDPQREKLCLQVQNYNKTRSNDPLGDATIPLADLVNGTYPSQDMWIELENIESGSLHIQLEWRPFMPSKKTTSKEIDADEVIPASDDHVEKSREFDSTQSTDANVPADTQSEDIEASQSPAKKIPVMSKALKAIPRISLVGKTSSIESSRRLSSLATTSGLLTIKVIAGRNLPSADRNGFSDPYVSCRIGDTKKKTSIKQQTLEPVWDEILTFSVWKPQTDDLHVVVKDHDNFSSNDFLGALLFNLQKDIVEKHGGHVCQWFPLENPSKQGELRLEIEFRSSDFQPAPPSSTDQIQKTMSFP